MIKLVSSNFADVPVIEENMCRMNITIRHRDLYHQTSRTEVTVIRSSTFAEGWVYTSTLKSVFVADGYARPSGDSLADEVPARAFFEEYSSIPGHIQLGSCNFFVYRSGYPSEHFVFLPNGHSKIEVIATVEVMEDEAKYLSVGGSGLSATLVVAVPVQVNGMEVAYLIRESYTSARRSGWVRWSVTCPIALDFDITAALSRLLNGDRVERNHPNWTVANIRGAKAVTPSIMDIFLSTKA